MYLTRTISSWKLDVLSDTSVECAYCKEPKLIQETTWFMPEPGEHSVRLCDFCYNEARKQLRLLRLGRIKGEFPTVPELTS